MTGRVLDHDWFPEPLPENVLIGERSWCYSSFAFVHYRSRRPVGVRIGSDSGIYHNSFFELGPDGEVEIGRYCAIVGAIISTNGRVVIGDYAFVAHEVVIADDPWPVPFRVHPHDDGHRPTITIGENAWIGARVVLLDGADIGRDAIVGAGCVVDFAVPAGAVVAGSPARIRG